MAVSRIRRTLSFNKPNLNHQTSFSSPKGGKSYHVRSVSLPCRTHPLLSQLKDEINELKTWASKVDDRTSSWLCDGLMMLKDVHDSVDDLLQLPQTQASLRRRSDWVENLLEDFLRFVDVFGIFRASLVTLKEEQLSAQVAIRRRRDYESKLSSYAKARRNMEKEMEKLVSIVRSIGRCSLPPPVGCASLLASSTSTQNEIELAGILKDVNEVTVLVSVCVFNGISKSSMGGKYKAWASLSLWKNNNKEMMNKDFQGIREFEEVEIEKLMRLRKQKEEEEVKRVLIKMENLENSIEGIEKESEKMFRSLLNTRVSLLNICTQ
ncbi:hypothetical protein C5167_038644 [Papaver somniferum]|uniref:Uncharacterized protein n=1 Tax=Papaver somniferum TaxID=3469 RepID=A0A4Y7ID39_PAPSO|nr:uncharacterized protein LOC113349811 [Papaver somniferum]RZC45700.1 hypothetical protein C5167_038644 [Papaver somniferum]